MENMIKDALPALHWEKSPGDNSFHFTVEYEDNLISGVLELTGALGLEQVNKEYVNLILKELSQWDEQAKLLLNGKFPDEDADQLGLGALEICPDSSFRLGYAAGSTPAGELYLYVNFGKSFIPDEKVIYRIENTVS